MVFSSHDDRTSKALAALLREMGSHDGVSNKSALTREKNSGPFSIEEASVSESELSNSARGT